MNRLLRTVLATIALVGGSSLAQTTGTSGEGKVPLPAAPQNPQASMASPTPAAGGGALTVITEQPRTVFFNEADTHGRIARLSLVLKSPKTGDLDVSFQPDTGGVVRLSSTEPDRFPSGPPALFTKNAARPAVADKGVPVTLALSLGLAQGAPAKAATGLLVVALKKSSLPPATLQVEGHGPSVSFSPSPVKLSVTRWLGFLSPIGRSALLAHRKTSVGILGAGVAAVLAGPQPPPAVFRAENGDNLEAVLELDKTAGANGIGTGTLRVNGAHSAGKYTGQVVVDPYAPTPTTLPAEVQVQDFFVVPLLWLLGFAVLGGYLVRHYNVRRRRSLLLATVEDAVDRYGRERDKAREGGLELYVPGPHLFPEKGELVTPKKKKGTPKEGGKRVLPQKPCEPEKQDGEIMRTYWEIWRADSDDEFAELTGQVSEIVVAVDRWHEVYAAASALHAARGELRTTLESLEVKDERSDPALWDADHLLETARREPKTEQAATALIASLHGQHTVLGPYGSLHAAWNEVESDQATKVRTSDPRRVYVAEAGRDPSATVALRVALLLATRALEAVRHAPTPDQSIEPPPSDEATMLVAMARGASIAATLGAAGTGAIVPPAPPSPAGATQASAPTPPSGTATRQVLGHLNRWNWIIAIATAVLTGVFYLLPLYGTGVFGSWQDYAKLAAVGFLGSSVTGGFVLNWNLFPSMQSDALPRPAQPGTGGPTAP